MRRRVLSRNCALTWWRSGVELTTEESVRRRRLRSNIVSLYKNISSHSVISSHTVQPLHEYEGQSNTRGLVYDTLVDSRLPSFALDSLRDRFTASPFVQSSHYIRRTVILKLDLAPHMNMLFSGTGLGDMEE